MIGFLTEIAGEIIAEFVVSGKAAELAGNVVEAGKNVVNGVGNAVQQAADNVNESIASLTELSYKEAMRYYVDHQHDSPAIAKGVLFKQAQGDKVFVVQAFLDKSNKLVHDAEGNPLGSKFIVNRLDAELLAVFKQHDIVIVE
jgi:hypothetical protein